MHAVERLLAEHRDLQRLVGLLERQPSLSADATAPNIGLLVDAMFYLTRFPDVTHHPLEDRITERLLARRALDAELGAEIEAQHARLARQGLDLLRDLEGALREESMSHELAADNMRLYAERLRHNMAFEELTLFPAALRHLDEDDWRIIGPTAHADPPDPLFHSQVQARFLQLHEAIAQEAGCDCEGGGA
jgi:hemerythrin-like domain-containing protein